VGWSLLFNFLSALRYLVAVQLLWILFAQLDMLLIRTTFRLLLMILCSRSDVFIFNISDVEHQSCGISISTSHSVSS